MPIRTQLTGTTYKLIYIASVLLLSTTLFSCKKNKIKIQDVTRLESHTGNRINRVQFVNNVGLACGGERFYTAEIIRSEDGGNTWNISSYPEAGKGMYGMAITPSGDVMLSGYDGKILTSTDEGQNWHFHQMNIWKFFVAIARPTEDKCVFVTTSAWQSGNIVRTDGDLNVIDTFYFKFGLNDITMPSANVGYVCGYGAILKTEDGGATWNYLDIKNDNFIGIHSLNENQVWVCGNRGSIFRTNNGGATWDRLRNGNSLAKKRYDLLNIYFKDEKTGWACGDKGLLIGTTDGGENWSEYEEFTSDALRDITLAPDGSLIVVGDGGGIYKLRL